MTRAICIGPVLALHLAAAAGSAAANGGAPEEGVRSLTGSVTYLQRIALPPGSEVIVEAVAPDGTRFEATAPSAGAQVPLPFALTVPEGLGVTLRAGIRDRSGLLWLGEGVAVPAGEGPVDLGELTLAPHVPMGMASVIRCGDAVLQLGFLGDGARLRAGADRDAPGAAPAVTGVRDLAPQPAASGARFATPDGATWVWSRGDALTVQLDGERLPDCRVAPAPLHLPVVARGNEPFWRVDISAGQILFRPLDGPVLAAETPLPEAAGQGWHYAPFGLDLAVTLRPAICRDSMTGLPYPAVAEVATAGQVLAGCAGDPSDLLSGGAWTVSEIGGSAVPDGIAVTMAFDPREGRVAGSTGCNRFSGGFALTGEGLSMGPAAATRMACPGERMEVESRFLAALEGIDGFGFSEAGELLLLAAGVPAIRAWR